MTTTTDHTTELHRCAPWATESQIDEEGWVELRRTWGGDGASASLTLLVEAHQEGGTWVAGEPELLIAAASLTPADARELAGWLLEATALLESVA